MSGQWRDSDRKSRLPADWPARVAETKRLAKNRCQQKLPSGKRCPRRGVDCDHISRGDDHRQSNLQMLCVAHHTAKTTQEAAVGRRRRKKIRPRTEGQHPGTIG